MDDCLRPHISPDLPRSLDQNIMNIVVNQAQPFKAAQTMEGVQTKLRLSRISEHVLDRHGA